MPDLRRGERTVRPPVVTVAGGSVPLKVLPLTGEKMPFTVTVVGAGVAAVEGLNNRVAANFATFRLKGIAAGSTRLQIGSAAGGAPLIVAVEVQAAVVLPDAGTDAGMLARLLLAEAPPPGRADYAPGDARTAMSLMRLVLENRLATPSSRWSSSRVRTLADVVRSREHHLQYEGFGNYPALTPKISDHLADMLSIANDPSDGRQAKMRAHVELAVAVATGPVMADPTPTGLYWWVTANAAAPGTGITLYTTVLGNSFYREGR